MLKPIDWSKAPKGLNTPLDQLKRNCRHALSLGLPQARPYPPQDREICIVTGGPSLNDTWDELQALYDDGAAILTVNNTHDYLIGRGIEPHLFVMLDARPFNTRFLQKPIAKCKYFLAWQCDPSAFEALRDQELYIFHGPISEDWDHRELLEEYYFSDRHYALVPTGTTVGIRSIFLAAMLGFRRQHLFGMDSCWLDGKDHAYPQPENRDRQIAVRCAGKEYLCAPWMARQAYDFTQIIKRFGDSFELAVHGDGLLAHILKAGAERRKETEHELERAAG